MSQDMGKEFKVVFTLGELNSMLQGLQYVPYGTAAPIIEKLQQQVTAQIDAEKADQSVEVGE